MKKQNKKPTKQKGQIIREENYIPVIFSVLYLDTHLSLRFVFP